MNEFIYFILCLVISCLKVGILFDYFRFSEERLYIL